MFIINRIDTMWSEHNTNLYKLIHFMFRPNIELQSCLPLYWAIHSVVLILHIRTVPSRPQDRMLWVSGRKQAVFTAEVWPLNSFIVLPDLRPWIRIVLSEEVERIWLESRLKVRYKVGPKWARSNLRRHCPVWIYNMKFEIQFSFTNHG